MTTWIATLIAISAMLSHGSQLAASGRAVVDWIAVSGSASPGRPLETAIRIRHDAGWHSYWLNPGEAGMPTTVEWKLPPGWQQGGLRFPAPARFVNAGLAGFGYQGTLLLPVTVTPPDDFSGNAKLEAVVSWLACSDDGCVPGEAAIALEIRAGDPAPGAAASEILAAGRCVPHAAGESIRLIVTASDDSLTLVLLPANPATADFSRHRVFPLTQDVIDPSAVIRFTAADGKWTAIAPKSGFATTPVKSLSLVLDDGNSTPLQVDWKIQ
jgi:thiol:disulfide interchange protein DsbD